VASRK
jgi:hypothetical protein